MPLGLTARVWRYGNRGASGMVTRRQSVVRHGQLELAFITGASPDSRADRASEEPNLAFMHRSLCIAGMPHRRGIDRISGRVSEFDRRGSNFGLQLVTPHFHLPSEDEEGVWIPVGVPYGAKARLLVLWMVSQAHLNLSEQNRVIEIGHIKEWLTGLGISTSGGSINETKDQFIRLCHTMFSMTVRSSHRGTDEVLFTRQLLIRRGILGAEDMQHYGAGQLDKVRWPASFELTLDAYVLFQKDSIPVPAHRLREIAHSATAIDLFLYLCYRLPLIRPGEHETVTWRQLSQQFGSLGSADRPKAQSPSRHRELFASSLDPVLRAYPEAHIEATNDGLVLHHSDPAVLRRAYIAGATLPGQLTKGRRKRAYLIEDDKMSG
jgi:hypothetical protein